MVTETTVTADPTPVRQHFQLIIDLSCYDSVAELVHMQRVHRAGVFFRGLQCFLQVALWCYV